MRQVSITYCRGTSVVRNLKFFTPFFIFLIIINIILSTNRSYVISLCDTNTIICLNRDFLNFNYYYLYLLLLGIKAHGHYLRQVAVTCRCGVSVVRNFKFFTPFFIFLIIINIILSMNCSYVISLCNTNTD